MVNFKVFRRLQSSSISLALILFAFVFVCVVNAATNQSTLPEPSMPQSPLPDQHIPLIAQNYSRVARHDNHRATVVERRRSSTDEDSSTTCGGIYRNANTRLTSPHYPANYPPNLHCTYEFRSPVRCSVDFHVHFADFNVRTFGGNSNSDTNAATCTHDRLYIADAEVLCGRVIGGRTYRTADDGVLRILLHSNDDSSQRNGSFELHVQRSACVGGSKREKSVVRIQQDDNDIVTAVYPIYERRPQAAVTAPTGQSTSTTSTTTTNDRQYLPSSNFYPSPVDPNYAASPGSCWNIPAPSFPVATYPGGNVPFPVPNPGTWSQYPVINAAPNPQPPSPYDPAMFPYYYPTPNLAPLYPNQPPTTPPSYNQQCIPYCLPAAADRPSFTPSPSQSNTPTQPTSIITHQFPVSTHNPQTEPQQAQIYPHIPTGCCTRRLNQRRFYLTSTSFPKPRSAIASNSALPSVPQLHTGQRDCLYHIERAHPSVCRLRIEFRFFNVGTFDPLLGCQHAYVEIDGQHLCGCNTGLRYVAQWGTGTKLIRVRQWSSDDSFGLPTANPVRGFWMDVVQEDCPYRIRQSQSGQQTTHPINRRADQETQLPPLLPLRIHSTMTQTNSTSTITHVFYNSQTVVANAGENTADAVDPLLRNSKGRDTKPSRNESKAEFEQRTEEPASSQFFFLENVLPNHNRRDQCTFSYAQYLRLASDPLWQLRPRCDL